MIDLAKTRSALPWSCLYLSFLLWAASPVCASRADALPSDNGAAAPALSPANGASAEAAPAVAAETLTNEASAAQPEQVRKVPVHFSAERGSLQVEAVGPAPARCTTPCTLLLRPGKTQLAISGDASFTQTVDLPDHEVSVELSTRRRGRAITGGVFLSVGFVAGLVGGVLLPLDTGVVVPLATALTGLTALVTG